MDVKDDRSKVKLTLDIGTELGLSDVMAGYEMGGPQIVITEVRTNWYRNDHSCSFFHLFFSLLYDFLNATIIIEGVNIAGNIFFKDFRG